jgi:hypothetical protein
MKIFAFLLVLLSAVGALAASMSIDDIQAGKVGATSASLNSGGQTYINSNARFSNTVNQAHGLQGTNMHQWWTDQFGTQYHFDTNGLALIYTNGSYFYVSNNGQVKINGSYIGDGSLLTGLPSAGQPASANLTNWSLMTTGQFVGTNLTITIDGTSQPLNANRTYTSAPAIANVVTPGAIATQGMSFAFTASNNVGIDSSHHLALSNAAVSSVLGVDAAHNATNFPTSGGVTVSSGVLTLSAVPNSSLANSSISFTDGAGIGASGSPTSLGGTLTLSATTATPQFTRLGLGAAADGTAAIYAPMANNAATEIAGIILTNSTIATSGNVKSSPRIDIWGNGFGTTGSTNAPIGFSIGVLPTSAGTAAGSLIVSNMLGAAAPSQVLAISSAGALTVQSTLTIGNNGGGNSKVAFGTSAQIADGVAGSALMVMNSGATAAYPIVFRQRNLTKTSNYTLGVGDTGVYINNIGASGAVTNTLPTAIAGEHYSFYIDVAQILCVQVGGADTIRYGATVSAAGGNIFGSAVGNTLHVFSPKANVWIIDQLVGTWTGPQ